MTNKKPLKLGVNIDHIATLRNARQELFPDIIKAGLVCQKAGANSITAHLREDRRHIKDNDIISLKKELSLPLNMEMATTEEMLKIATTVKPNFVCLVPEKREEITTEGGLDIFAKQLYLKDYIKELQKHNILVSVFIEPSEKQLDACLNCGANSIEIHTGCYANSQNKQKELERIKTIAKKGSALGLNVHAGHGLDYQNVTDIANIDEIVELNIGFAIVAESVFIGLESAVLNMKALITR